MTLSLLLFAPVFAAEGVRGFFPSDVPVQEVRPATQAAFLAAGERLGIALSEEIDRGGGYRKVPFGTQ